ncbi:aldehyde dehydrogenase [Streptomyces sp. KL116D]|uniref:aldehyde dehydrogenase family protein n=1 Tax=Streptomyces sp. KL116D TaxID=3045152 RepID=UPI003557FDB5
MSNTISEPPLELLPEPVLRIGDTRVNGTEGGDYQHTYAATGRPTATVPLAGAAEIEQAVRAARAALPGWRATPADRRRDALAAVSRLITEHTDRLSRINVIDNGTPLTVALAQGGMAADLFAYNAGWADKGGGEVHETWPIPALDYSLEEPYGVIGVIIPWNGPITALGQVLAPALAAGNCVVVKPPELAPFSALAMAELFDEAGIPPGVVSVLPGGPEAGEALVRNPGVDKIHFTGSAAVARRIASAASERLVPLGFELGGKSAVIVFDDADIDTAIQSALAGISVNLSGQGCINGTRTLVQRGLYDDFQAGLTEAVGSITIGDPMDARTTMGPVISELACERILGVIDTAVTQKHGRLVAGGSRLGNGLEDGYFIAPTVFADVDPQSSLAQEEIFGPVQSLIPFDSEDDAVRLANETAYGLAGYIHTRDLGRCHRLAASLEVGDIWVNGGFGIPASVPFGGVKSSGYGRIGGRHGIREFMRPKNVWIAL